MKYLLLTSTLLFGFSSYGQKITGTVVDKATGQPVAGAIATLGNLETHTNALGKFEITAPAWRDSLKIVHFAYKPYTVIINKKTSLLFIELESKVISLNEVKIHGDRDFKKDSIANRVEYAKQFNYTGPKVKDIFSTAPKQPGELLSVNLLALVEVLTKKSTNEYKFNKLLVRDEEADYVDRKFNSGNVSRITGLKRDTLEQFLIQYRPTYAFAKKASDYDMEVYIKQSFEKFKRKGMEETDPFIKKE